MKLCRDQCARAACHPAAGLLLALLLALALRLLVWRWHEFYPLGGDEQEYLQQALTLLRDWRYTELRLMRPPLYGAFLAGSILLVDSLVQQLRLVQALISTATVLPVWLLTRELARWHTGHLPSSSANARLSRSAPLIAALLCAVSYTLAAAATELLTETLFLAGLTTLFWLLVRASRQERAGGGSAIAAGIALGLLCLTRSVALPLLPLGLLWLLAARRPRLAPGLLYAAAALLIILPWTVRNYATYGGIIIIDTTGAENLWLDNDPAGREAVKARLYALGADRVARQQLATTQGVAAIQAAPQHFVSKAGRELLAFFALEYTDDMRARPVIWVPLAEVWARLLAGDGLWLLLLAGGLVGLGGCGSLRRLADPRWLLGAWALYILLTALLFHVELRYRLPLYAVLLPYAALALVGAGNLDRRGQRVGLLLAALALGLTLLHQPYPLLAWRLFWKQSALVRAERSLEDGHPLAAIRAARAALQHDPASALAQVAWARAHIQAGNLPGASARLDAAIAALPDHPHAHLLRGHMLRAAGQPEAARREFGYETASLQDLQAWSWHHFGPLAPTDPLAPAALDVGNGLDLGSVRGFHPAEVGTFAGLPADWRWTTGRASLRLTVPTSPTPTNVDACTTPADPGLWLRLRLAAGRPPHAPPLPVAISVAARGQPPRYVGRLALEPAAAIRDYRLRLPAYPGGSRLEIVLQSPTFTPRRYNPASADGRTLGLLIDYAQLTFCSTLQGSP